MFEFLNFILTHKLCFCETSHQLKSLTKSFYKNNVETKSPRVTFKIFDHSCQYFLASVSIFNRSKGSLISIRPTREKTTKLQHSSLCTMILRSFLLTRNKSRVKKLSRERRNLKPLLFKRVDITTDDNL